MGNLRGFAYLVREAGLGALSRENDQALFVAGRGNPAANVHSPDYSRGCVPRPERPLTLSLSPSGGEGTKNWSLSLAEGEGGGEGVERLHE